MKRVKILVASIILTSFTVTSCDDYLSEMPDNRTQLDSKEKIEELLVTAYPMRLSAGFLEAYSDNVFDSGRTIGETLANTKNYSWEFDEETGPDTPADYWDACYSAIAAANQALEAIEEMGNDDGSLNSLKAEALLARAYAHFQLVLIWGKPYNPATAEQDLGVPYVDEVEKELIKDYERASVSEVYEKIESDLEEGLKYVTNDYEVEKYHFNKNAAKAFAVNFYLTKGEWDKVLENSAYLGSKPAVGSFIRNMQEFTAMDAYDQMASYTKSIHKTNLLLVTAHSYYFRDMGGTTGARFGLTGEGSDGIFQGRNPLNPGKDWYLRPVSWTNFVTVFYPKYWEYFKLENPTAGTGIGYLNHVLLSNDEVYLNRMEALVMTNRIDEAMEELEYFISTRTRDYDSTTDKLTWSRLESLYPYQAGEFAPFYDITPEQGIALKAVLEAKRREFIQEGKRWFDIKRLNMVVEHKFANGSVEVLEQNDLRRQIPLPFHVVAAGLEDNPKN